MATSKSSHRRLQSIWTERLGEYITALAVAPDGRSWAASTAAGEIRLLAPATANDEAASNRSDDR